MIETPTAVTRRGVIRASAALASLFMAPAAMARDRAGTTKHDAEDPMRMMMRLTMPVEKGNEAIASGAWDQTLDNIIETLKPTSAYFYLEDGKRAAMFVYEAKDATEMAVINEPIFQALNATIEQQPVLTAADLGKALHPDQ